MSAETTEALDPNEALALSRLQDAWIAAYIIRFEGSMYRAVFLYDGTELEAGTLAGMESAIRAHWDRAWCGGYAGSGSAPWSAA